MTTIATTASPTLAPATYELERQLRALRVSGMAQTLLARNQEAIANHLAYTEFLTLLVDDEFARRRDRLFTRRLKSARVPQLSSGRSPTSGQSAPTLHNSLVVFLAISRFS